MQIKIFTSEIDPRFHTKVEDEVNKFISKGNVIVKDLKTSESVNGMGARCLSIVVIYSEI